MAWQLVSRELGAGLEAFLVEKSVTFRAEPQLQDTLYRPLGPRSHRVSNLEAFCSERCHLSHTVFPQ